jgi:hypothetical protein
MTTETGSSKVPFDLQGGYGCDVVTENGGAGGVVRVQVDSTIKDVLADIKEVRKKCSRKFPRKCTPDCPIKKLRYTLTHPKVPVDN